MRNFQTPPRSIIELSSFFVVGFQGFIWNTRKCFCCQFHAQTNREPAPPQKKNWYVLFYYPRIEWQETLKDFEIALDVAYNEVLKDVDMVSRIKNLIAYRSNLVVIGEREIDPIWVRLPNTLRVLVYDSPAVVRFYFISFSCCNKDLFKFHPIFQFKILFKSKNT